MSTRMQFFLALSLFVFLCPAAVAARQAKIRIGTYNLRMQQLDKGDNDWSVRRARVMKSIRDNAFDVFGVQELTEGAEEDLVQDLGKTYSAVFFSPYSQDGKGTKAQGILYKKRRFKLLEYHFFWPSDTPFVMTDNDHHVNNPSKSYRRGGICALFKDRRTGQKFLFINTHGSLNHKEHEQFAHVYVDMEKKFNPDGLPSFFVGDLNARPDHPSHLVFRAWWSDAGDTVPGKKPGTYNGFRTDPATWDSSRHIDYIYYRNVGKPTGYTCDQTLYDGFCASDHFPVRADFLLK